MLLCFLISFQIFGAVSYAADDIDLEVKLSDAEKEIITISGTVNDKTNVNSVIGIAVMDKGYSIRDYSEHTIGIAYAKAEYGTGRFTCSIGMSGHESGVYKVYALTDNGNIETEFKYVSQKSVTEVIDKIVSAEIAQDKVFESIYEINNGLGANLEQYTDNRAKSLFNKRFYGNRDKIDKTDSNSKIKSSIGIIENITKELEYIKSLENANVWSDVKNILKNTTFTKINLDGFNTLSNEKQYNVCNAFIKRNDVFDDADEIKTFFESKVKEYADGGSGNGNGNSSSGSGSGSSKGISSKNNYENLAPNKIETKYVFNDISSVKWAAEAISELYLKGIVNGTGNGDFSPNDFVTREQFAKMIVLALDIYDDDAECVFEDAQNEWYTRYIASLNKCDIVNGIGDNLFGIGQNISRQDMAVMIYNAFKYSKYEFASEKTSFGDFDSIADYARDAVAYLAADGVLNGMDDGNFMPLDNATRAEAAVVIKSLIGRLA